MGIRKKKKTIAFEVDTFHLVLFETRNNVRRVDKLNVNECRFKQFSVRLIQKKKKKKRTFEHNNDSYGNGTPSQLTPSSFTKILKFTLDYTMNFVPSINTFLDFIIITRNHTRAITLKLTTTYNTDNIIAPSHLCVITTRPRWIFGSQKYARDFKFRVA